MILARFSIYVHKGSLRQQPFHIILQLLPVNVQTITPFSITTPHTMTKAELIFFMKTLEAEFFFFQFEIIINAFVSSF